MHPVGEALENAASGGSVLTIQPGGNHGDTLIYQGFDVLCRNATFERVPFEDGPNRFDFPRGLSLTDPYRNAQTVYKYGLYLFHRTKTSPSVVYIHGGGNFNDIWGGGIECYEMAAQHFDCPIVIGPQSCLFESTDPAAIFDSVDNETRLFCREAYSYERMQTATEGLEHVSIDLADDTALLLTDGDLPDDDVSTEYTLVAMRDDAESANPRIDENISQPIRVGDVSTTAETFAEFVNSVAKATQIYTDRLHIAILGTILNKPVTWYEVGYHKSRGVYEHSLSDRKNVRFVYN